MNREQMIEKGRSALEELHGTSGSNCGYDCCYEDWTGNAAAVVDVILPQVTTVEELDALPERTVLVDDQGISLERDSSGWCSPGFVHRRSSHRVASWGRPLTIVWRP